MNRQIRLLITIGLSVCGLILALGLLVNSSPPAKPASAQSLSPTEALPCDFTAITVTAYSPSSRFRISDTRPGGAVGRTIYFANHHLGSITISVATRDTCYVWGGAAFSRTERVLLEPGDTPNLRWIEYPVHPDHGSTTVILTSSLTITGSVLLPAHRVVLTFTQDIDPPHDAVIVSPPYTTDVQFPVFWEADDADSGISFYTVAYSGTDYTTWQEWLPWTTVHSSTFNAPVRGAEYIFQVWACDYVGHQAIHNTATYVDLLHIYLPLVMRIPPPPPTGSVAIESGVATAYRPSVTLVLNATAGSDETIEMRIRNEDTNWSDDAWEPFKSTKAWTLASGGSGLRTVYAQFRGNWGGVSDPASDQIYLAPNGDFEDGYTQAAWQEVENPLPVDVVQSIVEKSGGPTPPADGSYALLLGNPDYPCAFDGVPIGYAGAEQAFSLPPDAESLVFRYIVWSQDACLGITYDRFEVYINDSLAFHDGNQVYEGLDCPYWWRVPGPENPRGAGQTSGWATGEIDLSGYAGQDVVVSFRNYNRNDDGWFNTYTYIDSVAVEGGW
jgi:hypothetical protein